MNEPLDPGALLAALTDLPAAWRLTQAQAAGPLDSVLLALGDASEQLAGVEVAQALAATDLVIELADAAGLVRPRARARRARAMALAAAGRLHDALMVGAEAREIAWAGGEPVEAARAQLAAVGPLAMVGNLSAAIAQGEAARRALLAAGEPVLAARADVSLGAAYDMRDDPARAVWHYDRARPALAADPVALAQLETNRGTALQGLDQFAAAEAAFLTALETFEQIGLSWAAAIVAGNLAHLATRQGRLERALAHFERARRHLEADESPAELARLRAEHAQALAQLGLPEQAVAVYAAVLPQLDALGAAPEAAAARFGLGQALGATGEPAAAERALAEAAVAFGELGQPVAGARADVARAALLANAGSRAEATALLTDALPVLSERPVEQLTARYHLARLAFDAGDLAGAAAALALAMTVATDLDLAPLLADLLHLRALIAQARGEHAAARADLREAVACVERVRGALQAERFRAAFLGNRLALYEALLVALLDAGEVEAAFAVAEQAKSRALLDRVSGALDLDAVSAASADPAEAALLAELARLRQELNWHYSRLDEATATGLSLEEWRRTVHAREAALQELQDRIAVGRGVAALYASPAALPAVTAALPPGTTLVEYVVAGDELLAFVVEDGEIRVARHLATPDEVAEHARQIRFQVGRAVAAGAAARDGPRAPRLLADMRRVLGAAHDQLLAPVLAGRRAETVVFVPHGPLHTMPLHALWDGAHYLIERSEVRYAPSASLLVRPGPPAPAAAPAAVVVGVADALAPGIEAEARAVAARLGDPAPLLGAAATTDRVTVAIAPAAVVHLACHGRFVPESPLASGLKLADGWLTARDIYAMRLSARLVTLSGCDTGRATVTGGDELNGLMRGFFAAGAPAVVMSLWTVDDASTTALMLAFYGAWADGAGAAGALRAAQLQMMRERPHPACWAPFLVGGNDA